MGVLHYNNRSLFFVFLDIQFDRPLSSGGRPLLYLLRIKIFTGTLKHKMLERLLYTRDDDISSRQAPDPFQCGRRWG